MISYYITLIIGFIIGYFLACLMAVTKGNVKPDIDFECCSFKKPFTKKETKMWEKHLRKSGKVM